MIQAHALDPDVRLELAPAGPSLDAEVAAAVDRLWDAEMAARGAGLFDGPLFSLLEHSPGRLSARAVTYRQLIASRRDPELARRIGLRPMGVTGLLLSPEGVVLGRRSQGLHTEPGRWEPAPAGALDRLDWRAVLLAELAEELGLTADAVSGPEAVALIEDLGTGVHDILCRVRTRLGADQITAAWRAGGTDEYDELAVLAPDALEGFLSRNADALSPTLRPMLRAGGLLAA